LSRYNNPTKQGERRKSSMAHIELRKQRISDAKRFYEILNNPNFIYFPVKPKSLEEEEGFLRKNAEKRKKNFEHNFAILYNEKVVGAIGIKIDQHRTYIGEIGYFVDEKYWGEGIATEAVKLTEKIGVDELGLRRIEILMAIENTASEKVAIKNGYVKEGILKGKLKDGNEYRDAFLYAKIV
jgi:ribosomal-protein-alanine N-acetyltransferase